MLCVELRQTNKPTTINTVQEVKTLYLQRYVAYIWIDHTAQRRFGLIAKRSCPRETDVRPAWHRAARRYQRLVKLRPLIMCRETQMAAVNRFQPPRAAGQASYRHRRVDPALTASLYNPVIHQLCDKKVHLLWMFENMQFLQFFYWNAQFNFSMCSEIKSIEEINNWKNNKLNRIN